MVTRSTILKGAHVNTRGYWGESALHYAGKSRRFEPVLPTAWNPGYPSGSGRLSLSSAPQPCNQPLAQPRSSGSCWMQARSLGSDRMTDFRPHSRSPTKRVMPTPWKLWVPPQVGKRHDSLAHSLTRSRRAHNGAKHHSSSLLTHSHMNQTLPIQGAFARLVELFDPRRSFPPAQYAKAKGSTFFIAIGHGE